MDVNARAISGERHSPCAFIAGALPSAADYRKSELQDRTLFQLSQSKYL